MSERSGRVLIVDDSEDDQLQLRRVLRREFEITAAFTGSEALARLERSRFDALITDQKMPRMSGDALIAEVKRNPETAGLRCILLSGRTSDEQLVEILAGGRVFHYFEKHKTLLTEDGRTELILAVRNAVQASRLEADRARLTARLKAQVDAVSGQYRLLRSLVDCKDPADALRLVLESLRRRLRCRAALAVLDLRPEGKALGHGVLEPDQPMTTTEWAGWNYWIYEAYERIAARSLPDDFDFTVEPETIDGSTAHAPRDDAPTMPVFVDRELRGLLVLVRAEGQPLEPDEQELFEVWRDQLQDTLTRLYTRRLDELRRIELMVEAMTEGVVLTDESGAVTLVNSMARELLGLGEGTLPEFSHIVSALGLQSLDVLRQIGRGEGPTWREFRRGDRDLEVLFAQVRDHGGRQVGVLTVVRDVTVLKRAERGREDFVRIITHELRSPLTSIGGVVDLLAKGVVGPLQPRQQDYLAMAKSSCIKLNGLVDDMLDLAKMEVGKLPMRMQPVHLDPVVEAAVRSFQPLAIEKGVELTFECPLGGLWCQADRDRLGQVLSNLLTNAFKFTPREGTIKVSIFAAFAVPDLYVVAVHNSGAEIPEGSLELIFKPFEQGQGSATVGGRPLGTGLGLSICRTIIQGHHGEIWVESAAGRGTTFLFSLPAVTPESGRKADEARPVAALGDRPVLVITGDEMEGYAVKALLLGLGFRSRVVPGEAEAVRAAFEKCDPIAALCVDVDGTIGREVLADLATRQGLTVIAMLPMGSPPPPAVDLLLEIPHDTALLGSALNMVVARQRERRRQRVLVADSDRNWASKLAGRLDAGDYLTYLAETVDAARARIDRLLPDLLVLDRALPGAAALEAELAARTDAPVAVLPTHADGPPGDDLLARDADRQTTLFEVRARLAANRRPGIDSLSVLPGAREVQREIQARMRDQQPFACGVIDMEGLTAGMERLGLLWGHQVMAQTAELVHQVLREYADDRAFLGHHTAHGFVFLAGPEHCATLAEEIDRAFGRVRSMIIGRGAEVTTLALTVTAVRDGSGADGYAALQDGLARIREHARERIVVRG